MYKRFVEIFLLYFFYILIQNTTNDNRQRLSESSFLKFSFYFAWIGHCKNFIFKFESVIAIKNWFFYGFFAQLTCGYSSFFTMKKRLEIIKSKRFGNNRYFLH